MSFSLTIFIPAYNEDENLPNTVKILSKKAQELEIAVEILIVNDCSQDQTGKVAEELARLNPSVRVFHHEKNLGIGGAFVTAIKNAQSEWLILIPADLAVEPEGLRGFIAAASEADVAVGIGSARSDYTLARRIVSWVNIRLIQILFGMRERQFQFVSMYRMATLREIEVEYWRSAFFHAEVLIKAKSLGKKLVEVEIKYIPRSAGRATGARIKFVIATVIDLFHFWLRWIWLGPRKASQRVSSHLNEH